MGRLDKEGERGDKGVIRWEGERRESLEEEGQRAWRQSRQNEETK